MVKQRIGRGPLTVALEEHGTTEPRLYVRDGKGMVVVMPVPADTLPDVRRHVQDPGPAQACDVELVDDHGQPASRWGSFAYRGAAAALAAVLMGIDRSLAGVRFVAPTLAVA